LKEKLMATLSSNLAGAPSLFLDDSGGMEEDEMKEQLRQP